MAIPNPARVNEKPYDATTSNLRGKPVLDRNAGASRQHAASGLMICLLVNDHTAISCSGLFSGTLRLT